MLEALSEGILHHRLLKFIVVALSVFEFGLLELGPCFASDTDARVTLLKQIRAQAKKCKDNEKASEALPLFFCVVSLGEQIYGPADAKLEPDLEDLAWSCRQIPGQFYTSEIYASRHFLISTYNELKGTYTNPGQEASDLEYLADNYMQEDNLPCATRLYADSVAFSQTAEPKDSLNLLAQISKLAWSRRKQFDNDRADEAFAKLVAKVEQQFGKRPIGASKHVSDGIKYSKNAVFDLAEDSYQRALNEDIKAIGPESAWAGVDCLSIAQQALFLHKMEKADNMARRAHAILKVACARKSGGENDTGLVLPLKELALAYQMCGENSLAELAWQRCVSLGGPSEDSCLRGQADFLCAIGQPAKAASVLEQLLVNYEKRESPLRPIVMRALANAYVAANNLNRAEEICKQIVASAEKEKQSAVLMIALAEYSKVLVRMDRMDEAAQVQARYDNLLKSGKR